jgi:integrase
MGTVQKRDDNQGTTTWQARVRRKGYPAVSRTFSSEKDAQQWVTEREAEMSRGVFVDTSKAREHTLADVIGMYVEKETPKKKGKDSEDWRLKAMARDRMAQYAVAHLTPAVIANYRDRRLSGMDSGRPVTGSTVNRELNLLHHVLEIARKDWGIGTVTNPVSDVRRPKSSPPRDRRLEPAEELALLAAASEARSWYLRPVVELAIETAMRQSEIVGLVWEQINLEDQVAYLKSGSTKNDEQRGVPLSKRAVEILRGLPSYAERKGPVFPGVTAEAVKRAFIRLKKRIGLDDFTFHDTRHEATSRLVEKDVFSETEIMSITGHKTSAMMRRYTHLRAKDLARKLG